MAINPFRIGQLEIPANPQQRPIDWSGLQKGASDFSEGVERERLRQEIGALAVRDAQGNIDEAATNANLARAGYLSPSDLLAAQYRKQQLAQTGASHAETARHHRAIEESAKTARVPFGWTIGPDGTPTATAGGPHDPEYIKKLAEIKQKPREFSVSDIGKLSEEGGKFSQVAGFGATFEPRFAGYTVPGVGGVAMSVGRYLPTSVVGQDVSEAASWWQGYDRYKNVIRNELYGSALTAHEQKAFAQADIDPSMTPDQIKKNLATQRQVVESGLKRKANALIASGYDPEAISKVYGLDLRQLGVDASGRRGTVTPAAPAPATTPAPGTVSRGYRFKGGDPSKQENWEEAR